MFTKLNAEDIKMLEESELGVNIHKFIEIVSSKSNGQFVELGVETGRSSLILLDGALERNNKVWGVDPIPCVMPKVLENPNYNFIKGDSVSTGNSWENGNIDILFVDSIHADVQVISELFAWWNHVKIGGWVIFHDTNWSNYIHKPTHPCAGKKPGNSGLGYDSYGGRAWATPDVAVKKFFQIENMNTENENILSIFGPNDLGMTFIQKKTDYDFTKDISDWGQIFEDRNYLLRSFGG